MTTRILRAVKTTREGVPVLKATLWDASGSGQTLSQIVEEAPFLNVFLTPPLPHPVAERQRLRVPEGAITRSVPVSSHASTVYAFTVDPDFPREKLPQIFLGPDQRYAPRSAPMDKRAALERADLLVRDGWNLVRRPEDIISDKQNAWVRRSQGVYSFEMVPVTRRTLIRYASNPLLDRIFAMWELRSKTFEHESVAQQALDEELLPLLRDEQIFGVDPKVIPYNVGEGLALRQEYRIRIRGSYGPLDAVYWRLRELPSDDLLGNDFLMEKPKAAARKTRRDPLGIVSRQFFTTLSYPALLEIDPKRPLAEQSVGKLSREELLARQRERAEADLEQLFAPDALRRFIGHADLEVRRWSSVERFIGAGEVCMAFVGTSLHQRLLSIYSTPRSRIGDVGIVRCPDEHTLADKLFGAQIPFLTFHNGVGYDLPVLRFLDTVREPEQLEEFLDARDPRRLQSGGRALTRAERDALQAENARRASERDAHGVGRTARRRFPGEVGDTKRAPQRRGGRVFADLKLETLANFGKIEHDYFVLDRAMCSTRVEDHVFAEDYAAGDGPAGLHVALCTFPAVVVHMLQTGRRYAQAMDAPPAEGYRFMRHQEFFRDRKVLDLMDCRSFAELQERIDTEPVGKHLSRVRRGRGRVGFYPELYLGTPMAPLQAFSPLIEQYPYVSWLADTLERLNDPLSRITSMGELHGFLEQPLHEVALYVRDMKGRLGTMIADQNLSFAALLGDDTKERSLNAFLHWDVPHIMGKPRQAYADRLADALTDVPAALLSREEGWVSGRPDGLYLYERQPVAGFVWEDGAVLLGTYRYALGCAPKPADPVWEWIAEAREKGPEPYLVRQAEDLLRVAKRGEKTLRTNMVRAIEAFQESVPTVGA